MTTNRHPAGKVCESIRAARAPPYDAPSTTTVRVEKGLRAMAWKSGMTRERLSVILAKLVPLSVVDSQGKGSRADRIDSIRQEPEEYVHKARYGGDGVRVMNNREMEW